jgi:hypothetical protein
MKARGHIITAAVALFTLLGGAGANAQSFEMTATIPFGFTAGVTTMSAGTYSVERLSGSSMFLVRGERGSVFLRDQGWTRAEPGKGTRLVFHRFGDRYFLRQVWFEGTKGYALPETREERNAAGKGKVASRHKVVDVLAGLN